MIVIYTNEVTNRLKYVFDFVFIDYFGLDIRYETAGIFEPNENIVAYNRCHPNALHFEAVDLLFKNDIVSINPEVIKYKEWIALFPVHGGVFSFDVFAAIFYLLSRYEEYLPFPKDEHGRFPSSHNLLVKYKMEQQPIVEIWLAFLKEELIKNNNNLVFKNRTYGFISTIDVDHLFAFKGKSIFKNLGGLIKRPKSAIARLKTIVGIKRDPFDTFDWLNEIHKEQGLKAKLFFLLNNENALNSQTDSESNVFLYKIKALKEQQFDFAIHPSYWFTHKENFVNEFKKFKNIFGYSPVEARQHFLRISFPAYFQKLILLGVKMDYSIGFSDINGFRSGISVVHPFFDLTTNSISSLYLAPFCIADHVDRFYQKRTAQQIKFEYSQIINNLKKINGQLITLFHNDSFGDNRNKIDWVEIFTYLLEQSNKKEQ